MNKSARRGTAIAGIVVLVTCFSAIPSATCQVSANVTASAAKIIFTQAARDKNGKLVNSGKPVPYIPIWTTNDGIGKGPPILSAPTPAFQISFAGTKVQATLLGTKHTLTKLQVHPPLYKEASSGLTVRLNKEPSDDTNAVRHLEAVVSLHAAGIRDSLYVCEEYPRGSSVFVQDVNGLVMTVGALNNSKPDSITLEHYQGGCVGFISMTETGVNSLVFTNETEAATARLFGKPTTYSPLKVAISLGGSFSNTVVQLKPYRNCGKLVYQNFAPPIPTNLPRASVPLDAAFYVEVHTDDLDAAAHPVKLSMKTNKGNVQIGQVNLIPVRKGVWQSVKPAVLCYPESSPAEMTASDRKTYLLLRAPYETIW